MNIIHPSIESSGVKFKDLHYGHAFKCLADGKQVYLRVYDKGQNKQDKYVNLTTGDLLRECRADDVIIYPVEAEVTVK